MADGSIEGLAALLNVTIQILMNPTPLSLRITIFCEGVNMIKVMS
jgi:hypothetical protein